MSGYQSRVRWKKTDGCEWTEMEKGGTQGEEGQGRKDIMRERGNKIRKYIKKMRKNTRKTYIISRKHTLHMKSSHTQVYTHI